MRIAQQMSYAEIGCPAAAASGSPRRNPAVTASTATCGDIAACSSGAKRTSA